MIKNYTDLHVYRDSHELFGEATRCVEHIPTEQQYAKKQLLRSAQSIHANIAEGFGRSDTEFKQYLRRALGSNNETLSHLEDLCLLGCVPEAMYETLKERYTILGKRIYTLREKWAIKKSPSKLTPKPTN